MSQLNEYKQRDMQVTKPSALATFGRTAKSLCVKTAKVASYPAVLFGTVFGGGEVGLGGGFSAALGLAAMATWGLHWMTEPDRIKRAMNDGNKNGQSKEELPSFFRTKVFVGALAFMMVLTGCSWAIRDGDPSIDLREAFKNAPLYTSQTDANGGVYKYERAFVVAKAQESGGKTSKVIGMIMDEKGNQLYNHYPVITGPLYKNGYFIAGDQTVRQVSFCMSAVEGKPVEKDTASVSERTAGEGEWSGSYRISTSTKPSACVP